MPPTKPVFDRLPDAKRRTVLDEAAAEFARVGFAAAKVDDIAARAGISVGSLYQYFGTKENCFLAVLDHGIAELQSQLGEVLASKTEPWDRIEAIVRLIPGHSRRHPEVVKLYYEIGAEGLSDLGRDFCERFEGLSALVYSQLLEEARKTGAVRSDVDPRFAAYFLDNLFVTLQFAYAGGYHRLRKTVYLGPGRDDDDEALVEGVMQFLRFGLAGK